MDNTSINKPAVTAAVPSRLPAGSTLEIAPGIHVPHPHAEVNLPGAGDPRAGATSAVSEIFVDGSLKQVPLLDEIKPKALTVDPAAKPIAEVKPAIEAGVAKPATQTLAVEKPNATTEPAKTNEPAK